MIYLAKCLTMASTHYTYCLITHCQVQHAHSTIIAELAERIPIIIQNSSNPSSQKNLDVWPYHRMTVQGANFNMCGQLCRGHTNATALFSSPVVSALGSKLDDLGSSPDRGKALCPWDVRGKKKMQAPLLGLAKFIYYCPFNAWIEQVITNHVQEFFYSFDHFKATKPVRFKSTK